MSAIIKKDVIAGKATRGRDGVSVAKDTRAAIKKINIGAKEIMAVGEGKSAKGVTSVSSIKRGKIKTGAKQIKKSVAGRIDNNRGYETVMKRIDELVEIPDNKLTKVQANELHRLAKMAQTYEKSIYTIKPPSTFEGVLEMKMYELKLTQGKMAKRLKVSDAKFSLILSGKQQPDVKFLKTVHSNLGIDGNYLLSVL